MDRFSGYLVDRVAELGNKLLVAGFAVSIIDLEQRRRAVAAEYAPECRRWVKLYTGEEHTGDLCVCWDREDDLFSTIHKIHGSHWYCGAMAVPIASWNEVLDMAEMLGFQISDMAQEAINTYRNHLNPAVSVSPAPEPVQQPDKLSAILNSSPDVLSDLKDEEQD